MMKRAIGDKRLSMNRQAVKVLNLLANTDPAIIDGWKDDVVINTSAWYNGRERGFALQAYNSILNGSALVVTVAESRNSDNIVIDYWVSRLSLNPPTVADFTDEAYARRRYIPYGKYRDAAHTVCALIAAWIGGKIS